jgi:hypothetical protein
VTSQPDQRWFGLIAGEGLRQEFVVALIYPPRLDGRDQQGQQHEKEKGLFHLSRSKKQGAPVTGAPFRQEAGRMPQTMAN